MYIKVLASRVKKHRIQIAYRTELNLKLGQLASTYPPTTSYHRAFFKFQPMPDTSMLERYSAKRAI